MCCIHGLKITLLGLIFHYCEIDSMLWRMYYVCGYMKRTTIMLPDDLKEKGMRKARRRGISLGELIRESLEAHVQTPHIEATEDPLFKDDAVFNGKAPKSLSKSHDRYLYGSE